MTDVRPRELDATTLPVPLAPPGPRPADHPAAAAHGSARDVRDSGDGHPAPPAAGRTARIGVRARVLTAVVLAAAVGIALAGTTAALLQLRVVDARVDASLAQEVAELRAYAAADTDPATGTSFTSVRALLFSAVQRTVTDEHESLVVLVDGEAFSAPGARALRLEDDPVVMAAARATGPQDDARFGRSERTTADGDLSTRFAVVPVAVPGDPASGVFVIGYDLGAERAEVLDTWRAFAAASVLALLLVVVVGALVAGRLLAPVRLLQRAAQRISDEDLGERIPVRGHDDLSELTRTVNGMLDRLDRSFTAQRSLLDDVGHELRTPLTVVRGHVELMDPHDPVDVAETRELALDEIDRMHRLVDDLVLLAQSQRPDFVRPVRVEVDPLVERALHKARALGTRRWRLDSRSGAVVQADPQRLVQALLQLAANAVQHTGPEDEVAMGASLDAGLVRVWVRDTGPGIPDADRERIFARFERGRPAERSADALRQGGSGLGLSIVGAIAEAHGGRVALATTPGAGATFSLELRADPEGPAGAGHPAVGA